MRAIRQAESREDLEAVRGLLREYQMRLGIDLSFQHFEDELKDLPGGYAPPGGRLFLACEQGMPLGCVALRAAGGTRCEMKRLFVREAARGLGLGRALVSRLLDEAQAIGYTEMVLDTLPTMIDAQHLYATFGFREIPPYCANPIPGTRFMARDLREPIEGA